MTRKAFGKGRSGSRKPWAGRVLPASPWGGLCVRLVWMLAVVVLFDPVAVRAATGPGAVDWAVPLSHQGWSTDEGLPDASVHQVFQSRDGYLWLATEGGAARFDGQNFKVYRQKTNAAFRSDDVRSIAEDASGALWFGTADGLIKLRGPALQEPVLRRFSTEDGLPSNAITAVVCARDGSLLVLTSEGVARSAGDGRFQRLANDEAGGGETQRLQRDPATGDVWLLGGHGVELYSDGTFSSETPHREQIARDDADGPVLERVTGPHGLPWFRTAREVRMLVPGAERVLRAGRDLPGSRVTALLACPGGTGWIGTNRGLFSVGPQVGATPVPAVSMQGASVLSLARDREGNLWVGTLSSGVHVLRPRKFGTEPGAEGRAVTGVAVGPAGEVWFGTREDGVFHLHGGQAEAVAAGQLSSPVILSLAAGPGGDLWVGTPDGLNHVQASSVTTYTTSDGLPDDFVRSVVVDAHNTVWAGTRRGLVRCRNGQLRVFTVADGLPSDSIGPLLLAEPAGDLWIGSSGGLARMHAERVEVFSAGPGQQIVTALAPDHADGLWVGVQGQGVARFDGKRFTAVRAAALPKQVTGLQEDRANHLWLRDAMHLLRADLDEVRACAASADRCSLHPESLGIADGMPAVAESAEGFPKMALGTGSQSPGGPNPAGGLLFVATRLGIAVTDPAHLPENTTPPQVRVQRFLVDGADQPAGKGEEEEAVVEPGHARYTFDFAALSFTLPLHNRYRYRLEGFDRGWVDAGNVRSALYTSLPPGGYRFLVEASNNDGVWSTAPAVVSFHIAPPVYRRWWFFLLLLLLAAGAVVAALRLRERSMQKRFALVLNERNRMAREVHDTLAQDLVSVSLQLDLASGFLAINHVEQARAQLKETRQHVARGLEDARQSIWNLRASTAQQSLPTRLAALAEGAGQPIGDGTGAGEKPRLKMGGAFRPLPRTVEDEVLRIAQEALSNVRRHAGATEIQITLHYETDRLLLTVQDNGRGFLPDAARTLPGHFGLRGMEERATALGASLRLESSRETGTTVSLLVPLSGGGRAGKG